MNFLFYAMIILLIVMTINNARRLKSFGNEKGFVEVYDCGQSTYTWTKNYNNSSFFIY